MVKLLAQSELQGEPDRAESGPGNSVRNARSGARGELPGDCAAVGALLRAQAARAGYLRRLRAVEAQRVSTRGASRSIQSFCTRRSVYSSGFMLSCSKRFQSSFTWNQLAADVIGALGGQEERQLRLLLGRNAAGDADLLGLFDLLGARARPRPRAESRRSCGCASHRG